MARKKNESNVLRDFLGLSDPKQDDSKKDDPKKNDQNQAPGDGQQDDSKKNQTKQDQTADSKKDDTGAKKDDQKSDDIDVKQIHDDQVKKTDEVPEDTEGANPTPTDEAQPAKNEPIPDHPDQSTGPKSSKVNPAEPDFKEVRTMNFPLSFYDNIRSNAFSYDHGGQLDSGLRDWIISTIKDDPELIQEACFKALPEILAADQSKIADVKDILRQAAENTERFRVVYIKKDDNQEFQDRAGAEAAIEPLKAFGVEFKNAFVRAWREVKADGSLGAKVAKVKVLDYFKTYDGDRDKLQAELCLSDEEVGKKKPQPQSGKKDGGKPKNDHK